MKPDEALCERFTLKKLDRQKVVRVVRKTETLKSRWSSGVVVDQELLFPRTSVREGSLWGERSGGGHCVKVQSCKERVWV